MLKLEHSVVMDFPSRVVPSVSGSSENGWSFRPLGMKLFILRVLGALEVSPCK